MSKLLHSLLLLLSCAAASAGERIIVPLVVESGQWRTFFDFHSLSGEEATAEAVIYRADGSIWEDFAFTNGEAANGRVTLNFRPFHVTERFILPRGDQVATGTMVVELPDGVTFSGVLELRGERGLDDPALARVPVLPAAVGGMVAAPVREDAAVALFNPNDVPIEVYVHTTNVDRNGKLVGEDLLLVELQPKQREAFFLGQAGLLHVDRFFNLAETLRVWSKDGPVAVSGLAFPASGIFTSFPVSVLQNEALEKRPDFTFKPYPEDLLDRFFAIRRDEVHVLEVPDGTTSLTLEIVTGEDADIYLAKSTVGAAPCAQTDLFNFRVFCSVETKSGDFFFVWSERAGAQLLVSFEP